MPPGWREQGGAGREARQLWRHWAVGFARWDHVTPLQYPGVGKDPDAGKGQGQEERWRDGTGGWRRRPDGRGFDQTPGGERGTRCDAALAESDAT